MLKRRVSVVLLTVSLFTLLSNTFAASWNAMNLQLADGTNSYAFQEPEMLPASEIERIRSELAAAYKSTAPRPSTVTPIVKTKGVPVLGVMSLLAAISPAPPETERFRIYPITVRSGGNYAFQGVFVGGNIASASTFDFLSYQLQSSATPTTASPSTVDALSGYIYPNSRLFNINYTQYMAQTDNWQGSELFSSLDQNVVYYFDLTFSDFEPASPSTVPEEPASPSTASPSTASPSTATPTTATPTTVETTAQSERFLSTPT